MILDFICEIADDPLIAERACTLGAGQLMIQDLDKSTKGVSISHDYLLSLLDCASVLASKG